MRIGIVCYPTYGGSGAAATELGRHLAARGHSVHLISTGLPFRVAATQYQENFFLHQIASVQYPVLRSELYTLSAAVKMAQLIREERLEILHSHYAVPHAVSAMLARQLCDGEAIKLVTTLHGTDITLVGSNPAFAPVVKMGIEHSDAVVSVSHWLAGETERLFGLDKPYQIIHNFVDGSEFKPMDHCCCARRCLAKDDEKILLHISNFRRVKRVDDVVRVFARVVQEIPSVLLMVGDGPDHDLAMETARELGVIDRIRFLGEQNDIGTLLGFGDLFLFPSEYESFGLAVLEAMVCEVPVVCSDGGGLPEVMVHEQTGYLCPVGDVETMAARAIEILKNPELGESLGKAARKRALERFSPEIAIDAHERLYESLLKGEGA